MICSKNPDKQPRVGYVVKRYPRFSETFIVNELLAHEDAGLPIEIFSLRPPCDTHFQDLISRVRSPLTYLSNGQVKAQELWSACGELERIRPGVLERLGEFSNESVLDVYCGIRLATHVISQRLTHLHAHFASSAATVAMIASHLAEVPFSMTAHAKDIFHESVSSDDLERKLRKASTTITVSSFNLRYLNENFRAAASNVTLLYNGMHLEEFPFHSPQQRRPKIVAVGRLVEKKGFEDLVDACALLRDAEIDFECLIIGSGDREVLLRKQISDLNLDRYVTMLGPQPQRDVKQLLTEAAAMAAPCVLGEDGNRDGLPTVLLEAMALGTPCVSTDVTGIPEVIQDEKTGLLVSQHSPSELANALRRLLVDSNLRVKLARDARVLIEAEFDINQNAQTQRVFFKTQTQNEQEPTNISLMEASRPCM